MILIGERLRGVVDAYHIGENSYRKTAQNLWLAFFFNGVGVPLAATGIVHPAWAMVAMAASVTAVLTNSFGGRLLPARALAPQAAAEAAEEREEVVPEVAREEGVALEATPPEAPAHVILEIPDIHCAGCGNNIETLLGGREGIDEVDANARAHRVQVSFQPERIGLAEIEEAVTSLGYRVQGAHMPGAES